MVAQGVDQRDVTLGANSPLATDDMVSETQEVLLRYLNDNALDGRRPERGVLPQTRYLDLGVLNSLGLVVFIEFVEDTFNIRFAAEDLQSYDFHTVAGLARIVDRLRGAAADG